MLPMLPFLLSTWNFSNFIPFHVQQQVQLSFLVVYHGSPGVNPVVAGNPKANRKREAAVFLVKILAQ